MRYRLLGNLQQEEVNEQVMFAVVAGINFIDTANVYSNGKSETSTTKSNGPFDETPQIHAAAAR